MEWCPSSLAVASGLFGSVGSCGKVLAPSPCPAAAGSTSGLGELCARHPPLVRYQRRDSRTARVPTFRTSTPALR
uniref:Putative secreted peptide n=1 Tax=Anopheles braziliensis TaxID=58242 RepID=A0A2M3ZUW4_9DIPT